MYGQSVSRSSSYCKSKLAFRFVGYAQAGLNQWSVQRVLLPTEASQLLLGHFLELSLGLADCRVHDRVLHRELLAILASAAPWPAFTTTSCCPILSSCQLSRYPMTPACQQQRLDVVVGELIEVNARLAFIKDMLRPQESRILAGLPL